MRNEPDVWLQILPRTVPIQERGLRLIRLLVAIAVTLLVARIHAAHGDGIDVPSSPHWLSSVMTTVGIPATAAASRTREPPSLFLPCERSLVPGR